MWCFIMDNSYEYLIEDIALIKKFLESGLTEMDYFQVDGDSLMPLKEYLIETKKLVERYQTLIAKPLSSIQKKNAWVYNVAPTEDWDKTMNLSIFSKSKIINNAVIEAKLDAETKRFRFCGGLDNSLLPFIFFEKKISVIGNSQEELKDIYEIAKDFNFQRTVSSVSKRIEHSNDYFNYYGSDDCGYLDFFAAMFPHFKILVQNNNVKLEKVNLGHSMRKLLSEVEDIDKEKLLTKVYVSHKFK